MTRQDEIRAAAERLRAWLRDYGHEKQPAFVGDLKTVLDAVAERPADDEQPIDEAWLWELAGDGKATSTAIGTAYRFRIDELSSLVVWPRASGVGYEATMRRIKFGDGEDARRTTLFCDLRSIATRGDLRRLAAALGIELRNQQG